MSNWNFQHFDTQSDFGVVDENGITHRVRKKPGRKANPAASAQRKAQNRAAQRAFRERKQREKKETDAEIRRTMNEVNHLRKVVKELRFENKQLKAMVISYILTCFELNSSHPRVHAMSTNSRVKLPADENMPALMNIFVDENGHILDLESAALNLVDADSPYPPCTAPSRSLKNEKKLHRLFDETLIFHEQVNPAKPTDCAFASDSSISPQQMVQDLWKSVAGPEQDSFIDGPAHQWPTNDVSFGDLDSQGYSYPPMHPIQAVQLLRLQMKVGSIIGADKDILNPTDLQRAIVHDRRIDYIPGPGLRDRMILFRDHYDADECFNLLATKSIFLGGEVTNPSNWALPEKFYDKYWFLCANQVGFALNFFYIFH
ncbi:hypothetical protein BGW37DRAFT_417720 [Umbelopsis sp. PMI_123]|nr:hypothetical protein BGW37DRAFT_417720 [Umbelopsis sp. PMI_123]